MFLSSGVAPKNAEVITGTETEIFCVITGLTTAVTSVTWLLNSSPVNGDGYSSTLTTLTAGSQIGKLLVKSSHVTEDKDYVCRVLSGRFSSSPPQDTAVKLSVYREDTVCYFQFYDFNVCSFSRINFCPISYLTTSRFLSQTYND